jgi:subtilase family serine protease
MRSRILASALVGVTLFPAVGAGRGAGLVRLSNHTLSPQAISQAKHLGRKVSSDRLSLAVALQVNDPAALARAVEKAYTPGDSNFGRYLTPEQFTAQYAPSQQEFSDVVQYLNERGLNVTQTHSNRLVIDVEGSTTEIEQAFGVQLHEYLLPDGRVEHAANAEDQRYSGP